ncbi:MAG TPA: hypothetical protein ENJ18_17060 [Nannocystis exedens]|nr:hypothetical protein [Nannocystis exedens]
MSFSLAREIDRQASFWPAALLPPEGVEAAKAAASTLPPVFHWLILEGRLTGVDRSVDLMASIIDSPGSREALALALKCTQSPLLEGARDLLSAWARPAAHRQRTCMEHTPLLWLEWDAPYNRTPLQLPFIDRRFWGRGSAASQSPEELVQMIRGGYAATFGEAHHKATLSAFSRMICALPSDARTLAAASLRPRGLALDRLFASLPRDRVLPWLRAIGWPGDLDRVRRWLPRIVAPWEQAFLQIELDGDGPNAYLGIEPRQTEFGTVDRRERNRLLRHLIDTGLSDVHRVQAVEAWTRSPEAKGTGPRTGPRIVRSCHLKCVLRPNAATEVKAYLGLHLRRRRRQRRMPTPPRVAALRST